MHAPLRGEFLAVFVLSISAACASPSGSSGGFSFCSSPVPPACIDDDKTYDDGPGTSDCQEKVSHYVASVFAYRTCLLREAQRAVLETNIRVDRFKCGLKSKRRCLDGDVRQNK
jgi:hypothetical protein